MDPETLILKFIMRTLVFTTNDKYVKMGTMYALFDSYCNANEIPDGYIRDYQVFGRMMIKCIGNYSNDRFFGVSVKKHLVW